MYGISDNYKTYTNNSFARSPKSKIVIDGVEYLDNVIMSCPSISHNNDTFIGGFPSKTCSFEIKDIDGTLTLNNKWITVYRGLYIDGATEWIPMGIFRAISDEDITTNKSKKTITFKGYDRRQLLDTPYTSSLDWSKKHTGLEIVQEACTNCGLELGSTIFNFATYEFTQQPNFPSDITNTEVISRMAEIGGEIALITREGKVLIKGPNATDVLITKAKRNTLTRELEYGPINTVVLGNEGYDDDIVYKDEAKIESSTTKNIIDLTKLSFSSTSSLIDVDEIQSNALKITVNPEVTAWSRLMFSIDDLLEDGETYTIAAMAEENSDILPDGTYGTIGLNRTPREGTQEQSDKTEIFMATTNYTYSRTTTWTIDKENYTHSLVFFPARDQTITEALTLVYKKIYIAKETSFSGYVDYEETGIKEWRIEDNPYVDLIRETIIEDVLPFIIGRSIIPFELNDVVDDFYLDINDNITIANNDGTTFVTTILGYDTINRIKSTIQAPVQTKTLSNYGIAGSSKQAINQVKLEVNHIDKKITSLVQATENVENELDSLREDVLTNLTSIEQNQEEILMTALKDYTSKSEFEEYQESVSTEFLQTAEDFTFNFNNLSSQITTINGETQEQFQEIHQYIRFENGNIILGESGNEITLKIENDRIAFIQNNSEVAYFSNNKLTVTDGNFLNSLQIGNFAFKPRANGNLSLLYVGGGN